MDRLICAIAFGCALAGCASSPLPSSQMGEANVVTPPLGYIDFCSRFPDQCGPETRRMAAALTASGSTPAAASRKYFWLAAFDGTAPNALGGRRGAAPDNASYDWRTIFHTTQGGSTTPPEGRATQAAFQPVTGNAPQMAATPVMSKTLWALLQKVNQDVNTQIHPIRDIDHYGFEDYWTLPIATGTMAGDCKDYVLEKRRILMAEGVPMAALSIALGTTAWGEYHAVLLVHSDAGDYVLDNLSPWVTPWKDVTYAWSKRQSTENPDIWVRPATSEN